MSSTSGVQNLLVNVFRPVYTYDPTTTLFTPKLELSNIDTYSGNTVSVFTAAVGDSNNNVYVGSNAGNLYTTTKSCSNVTAIGYGAGSNISNVSNSVFVGYNAGAGAQTATSNVIVGTSAGGNGNSNVRIGSSNDGTGNGNVSIGAAASTSTYSNCILLGTAVTATQNNQFRVGTSLLYGDTTLNWLGIGTNTRPDTNSRLDVSGNAYFGKEVGIQMVPNRTLDVNGNFRASDANGTLDFLNGVTSSSNGFASIRGTSTIPGTDAIIGPVKKGIILVSAVDNTVSTNYASRILIARTTSNVVDIGSNLIGGTASIDISGTDIRLNSVASTTYNWSITYLPL